MFLKNAILCLKQAGLQAKVRSEWFERCSGFLRRQVEVLQPRVVVALGGQALVALRRAYDLSPRSLNASVVDVDGEELMPGTRLLAVCHCGARTLNTAMPMAMQIEGWKRAQRVVTE